MLGFRIIAAQFVVLTALAFGPNLRAQDSKCFSIRILNPKNRKPVRGVRVDMLTETFEPKSSIGKTDKGGTLRYCPPEPAPQTFTLIFYQFGSGWDGPRASQRFKLADVFRYGAVVYYQVPPAGFKDKATPGGILVFGTRWKFIQRVLPEPDWP